MKGLFCSAGAEIRVIRSFAANAGFWTFPTMEAPFPFGFGRLPVSAEILQGFLNSPLHILLGDKDTDENHEHLNRSAGAMLQGRHRCERGQTFYQAGVEAAAACHGVRFGWTIEIVEGAGHSNKAMFRSVLRALASSQPTVARNVHGYGPRTLQVWQDWIPPCPKARGHERRESTDAGSSPSCHKGTSKDWHGPTRHALTLLGGSNHGAVATRQHILPT